MKYRFFLLLALTLDVLSAQTVDSIAIKQVDSLIRVSRSLTAKNDFDKAIEVNAAAENIAVEKLGRESAAYGSCAYNRGRVNYFSGNNKEAELWYLESIAIREKVLSKEHPDYAQSLNNLGILCVANGNYEKAEPLFLEAKAIREKVLGKEHPDYAASLNNLAGLYSKMVNYQKSETLYLEALSIREKVQGKEHPDYTTCLNNLAIIYKELGKYEKSESLHLESKAIQEKVLGKEHPHYAQSLNNLANLYRVMGKYQTAEVLYLESKAIRVKVLRNVHPNYAESLNNLASLYYDMGDFQKAEPLYLESQAIREKVLGKEHPEYAASLNNLAMLYRAMGNYKKAESLYLESNAIQEKVLGKEHPDFAQSLNNLAYLYKIMGYYEKAESLFLRSKAIREKVLGKEHREYALSLNHLAILYKVMGYYEKAEQLYLESKAIQETVLGKEHPEYAASVNNLAVLYQDLGYYQKAEPLYLESKAIQGKVVGKEHPDYVETVNNLAELYERQCRFSASALLFAERYTLDQARLSRAISFLSERELARYTATFQSNGDGLGSYVLARLTPRAIGGEVKQLGILPALIFDHALFYKGFLLSATAQLNATAEGTPESKELSLSLKSYRRRLAAEYAKPIVERKNVAELEEKANTAEKELARSIAGYADAVKQVKWQDVHLHLKQKDAAIEFISFKKNFPKATDSIMYGALLLKSGDKQPRFILLFEEKSLDSLLHSKSDRKADYVNSLYTLADRGVVPVEAPKKSLYEILWKPLEKELTGIKTIYFSPSGLLHRINLDAIPVSETETLADRYNLIELNSTRQLVIPTQIKNINNDAVLFGGIQFEQDSTLLNNEPLIASQSRGELSFNHIDSTLRGGSWNYLAGTEREVNSIEKLMLAAGLKVNLKKGYQATEATFKNIGANSAPSPKILHIATHGYFFPDPKVQSKSSGLSSQNEPVFKISDHPMLRSGLIMAGGNAAWQGKQTQEGREDGILTAYEISQMNLSNTELVVLSACETGLGDIQGNEGVYGLQRAFKIAGAKYLIMSLWQVPDKQTSLLMTTFYKKWLENKMTIPEAFHAAQKELREIGLDPYQWAGFVLVE